MSLFAMFNAWMLYRPFFKVTNASSRKPNADPLAVGGLSPAAPVHFLFFRSARLPAVFLSFM
jgi:hypothetical protein